VHCKEVLTVSTISPPQCIGITQLFCKLVCRPDASPKICNRFFVSYRSASSGRIKRATSSAYSDNRWPVECKGKRRPSESAFVKRLFKTSMTNMNNIGESGSPCRRPRWWAMNAPGSPFRITWVDAVWSKLAMRFLQTAPNPKCDKFQVKKPNQLNQKLLRCRALRKDLRFSGDGVPW